MMVCAAAAMESGYRKIMICIMDIDVVVLAVRLTQDMYEVVNELRRTINLSCNQKLGHDIKL